METGDRVWYWPDEVHALIPDASRQYPWRIGQRVGDEVRELQGEPLRQFIARIQKSPAQAGRDRQIVRIAPKVRWPATVTEANDDGTVNLDVRGSNTAVTLHLTNVKVVKDNDPPRGNTCFEVPEETATMAATDESIEGGE